MISRNGRIMKYFEKKMDFFSPKKNFNSLNIVEGDKSYSTMQIKQKYFMKMFFFAPELKDFLQ